ncbi:hypothetical protein [Microvirga arabica]|uniref:Lipoprotein n=1 Tax=Microvirga arabica TaxID=1128671 RepID=A0ABV6Y2D9_9HYPH|nr:hypothetical protein [Microvirga arabica]MBM1170740.1 hypothetical protein [Microvirga arabica]
MPTILRTFAAAALLPGLGGCVGTAGISTWDYRSGPGYETARSQESRIQVDSAQGLTHEACTRVSRRQVAASGAVGEAELDACRSH